MRRENVSILKVFISSTCYDLDNVRDGLRDFIYDIGYEPVMSDYGDVLYDPRIHTHTSCIEEVKNCDMLVLLIGGRFGGRAINEAMSAVDFEKVKEKIKAGTVIDDEQLSITHLEVLIAIEYGLPVYTFIKEDVLSDHKLYEENKDKTIISEITFPSIEKQNTAKYIFEFINMVRLRNCGNNIFPFKKESDIEDMLKKQWSSYFQKLIKEQFGKKEKSDNNKLEKRVDELQSLIWRFINEAPREKDFQISQKKKYRKILWVDDYPINNESVIRFFEGQNIHFDIALTTEQGLKLYRKELYDLIITDMGRGNERNAGITLIKELNFLHCQVPVVVYCSKAAIKRYSNEAKKLGAYRVINGIADIISLISDIYELSGF